MNQSELTQACLGGLAALQENIPSVHVGEIAETMMMVCYDIMRSVGGDEDAKKWLEDAIEDMKINKPFIKIFTNAKPH